MRRLIAWIPFLLASAFSLSAADSPSVIAIDGLSTGALVLLDESGTLFRLDPRSPSAALQKFAEVSSDMQVSDLTVALSGREEMVYITAYRAHGKAASFVQQYSAAGRQMKAWELPWEWNGPFAGITANPTLQTIYVANSQRGEIYELRLTDKVPQFRLMLRVRSATTIAALGIDVRGQRLFCADSKGKVFSIDIASKSVTEIANSLGEPRALVFDAQNRKLYVADAARARVWLVRVDQRSSRPAAFAADKKFREPSGLAMDARGMLWMGDPSAQAVFSLSLTGQVLRVIR